MSPVLVQSKGDKERQNNHGPSRASRLGFMKTLVLERDRRNCEVNIYPQSKSERNGNGKGGGEREHNLQDHSSSSEANLATPGHKCIRHIRAPCPPHTFVYRPPLTHWRCVTSSRISLYQVNNIDTSRLCWSLLELDQDSDLYRFQEFSCRPVLLKNSVASSRLTRFCERIVVQSYFVIV